MAIPDDLKDRAVYHLILGEMHRMRGIMLNLQTLDVAETQQALREHYAREQTLALGKLTEWRKHRPEIYREAEESFSACQ